MSADFASDPIAATYEQNLELERELLEAEKRSLGVTTVVRSALKRLRQLQDQIRPMLGGEPLP